jgi:TRAP transporter 4TM/12TM fusion protein
MTSSLITGLVVRLTAITLALFHLYTAYFGTFYPFAQRAIPLMLAAILAFLTIRASSKEDDGRVPFYDWLLAAATIPAFGYVALYYEYLANRWPLTLAHAPTMLEMVLAVVAIVVLLEAARRTIGWVLVIVVGTALLYVSFGEYIGWQTMAHRGFEFVHILDYLYLTIEGIWGTALGIAATYITLFVIFGAFMEKGGATEFFVDLANAIAGESRGGPAKVAIFSSGMIGSVTGSTVANVYTTGQLTIPMMKRTGYRPSFAGAVEALASNGGQLMPPVMGAAAFILAAYSGISYFQVMVAAVIPALLYFGMLFWYIHLEAIRTGLKGLPKGQAPSVVAVLKRGGHLLLPLVLLIVLLARGHSPMPAGFYAIVLMIVVSWFRKDTRIGPKEFVEALEAGAKNSVMIIIICGAVGLIIGTFTLTGMGLNLSQAIINLSGGNFILLLLLIGVASIVLGTGMNTVAAFILVSVVAVPALQAQGVDRFLGNMFVFYFSLLAHITPPVCLAVFAGAAIARANPWETAFVAVRLGVVAYLLPFLVVFSPGLLLMGTTQEIVLDVLTTAAGAMLLIAAIQGWMFLRMGIFERLLATAAALGLLWPTMTGMSIGFLLGVATIVLCLVLDRRTRARTAAPSEDRAL